MNWREYIATFYRGDTEDAEKTQSSYSLRSSVSSAPLW